MKDLARRMCENVTGSQVPSWADASSRGLLKKVDCAQRTVDCERYAACVKGE